MRLMGAVSALVLGAGAAQAQNNTNTSEVSQTGFNNNIAVDNTRPGNDFNRSVVLQNGRDNRVVVLQVGDFNASFARQIGNLNVIVHTQEGDFNRAESNQTDNDNRSAIRQRGVGNSATVDTRGSRNVSLVAQGVEATDRDNYDFSGFFDNLAGATRVGNDNRVTVDQLGDDFSSTIRQRAAAGSAAPASNNTASVLQRGQGNSSTIVQESRGNQARVLQFNGGGSLALQNRTTIEQRTTAAAPSDTTLSNNRADVSVAGQSNVGVVRQDGRNNEVLLTQGRGSGLSTEVVQTGTAGTRAALIAQYAIGSQIRVEQAAAGATATVWQQPGPPEARGGNNLAEVAQGTGATGRDAASAAFFGNAAPVTGAAASGLSASVTQGNSPAAASWNRAQVLQDGVNLSATLVQAGTGTAALPNVARVAQQGTGNTATARQTAGVGPSAAGDPASGRQGDEGFFAGGARSAELAILQSGANNSASIEQRGRGQVARIEQGPGTDNLATILQDGSATNATAIIRQTGSGNSYNVVQTAPGQYIRVVQTGNGNVVTDVVQRP